MISFNFLDVIKILLAFSVYGVVASFVIVSLNVFFIGFKSILSLNKYVWGNSIINSAKIIKNININKNISFGVVFYNLRDFLSVFILGIGYLLVQYAFSDGVFRIYALLVFCIFCYLSYKFVAKYTEKFFIFIYSFIYKFVLLIISIICYPIGLLAKKTKKLFLSIPFKNIKKFINGKIKKKVKKNVVGESNRSVRVYKLKRTDKNAQNG